MRWTSAVRSAAALCAAAAIAAHAADGTIDAGFGSGGFAYIVHDETAAREIAPRAALALPDGKLLFAGTRNKLIEGLPPFEPQVHAMLARLDAAGQPDAGFGNVPAVPGLLELPDLLPGTRMQVIEAMQRFGDGAIVVAGTAFVDLPAQGFVVKLDADGALDAGFGDGGIVRLPAIYLHAVAIDGLGRVVVCGERVDGQRFVSTVARLLGDGRLDEGFGDGGLVTIGWSGDAALSGYLNALAITPGDGVLVGGSYELAGPWPGYGFDYAVARLDAAGAFDPAFAGSGWRVFHDPADASTSNGVHQLARLADGRIVFTGHRVRAENRTGLALGRLLPDGSDDTTFGDLATPGYFRPDVLPQSESITPTAFAVQADGKLLVAASYYVNPDKQLFFALRTTADGRLDATFADGGIFQADLAPDGAGNDLSAMALQADGRIVLAGRSLPLPNDWSVADLAAVRLVNHVAPPDRVFADGFD